jgi:hypothetical protein
MKNTTPKAAQLIEQLRTHKHLSVAEAARRAQLSEARWRQIAKGVQQINADLAVPVIGPASTLARMALVVGATPEQMAGAGRPDAAEMMAVIAAQPDNAPGDAAAALAPALADIAELEVLWGRLTALSDELRAEKHRLADLSDEAVLAAFDVLTTRVLEVGGAGARPFLDGLYGRAAVSRAALQRRA